MMATVWLHTGVDSMRGISAHAYTYALMQNQPDHCRLAATFPVI